MNRCLLWSFGCVCSVAIAAAPLPVFASEWIGSESESIGTFNNDDNFSNDLLNDLFESLDEVIDFENTNENSEEDNSDDLNRNSEDFDQDSLDYDNEEIQDYQIIGSDSDHNIDYIEPLSDYSTYYGAIGSTYLEYMRGFLPKLGFKDHYVAARTSNYDYVFAYGDLEYTGTLFRGSNITVIRWNTYNTGTYYHGMESSFNLSPGGYMVYSDLSDFYPSLADTAGFSSRQIFILLVIMGLVWTIDHMYQVRKIRRLK